MRTEADIKRVTSGRSRLSDNVVGSLTHAVVASLLEKGLPLSIDAARTETDNHLPPDLATVCRQSIRQKVGSAVSRYDERFARVGWRFAGSEVVTGDVAFDLLWISPEGLLEADELKTGLNAERHISKSSAQCLSQVAEGNQIYGERFLGVRLVLLAAAREVYFANSARRGEG